jgi:hypothetical protein
MIPPQKFAQILSQCVHVDDKELRSTKFAFKWYDMYTKFQRSL